MSLPPNFDSSAFMKKVPPPPFPGQLWYFTATQQLWHVIALSSGEGPIPSLTIAIYGEGQEPGAPQEIRSVKVDEFYRSVHTGAQLLGPRGITWPSGDNRTLGFGR